MFKLTSPMLQLRGNFVDTIRGTRCWVEPVLTFFLMQDKVVAILKAQ